MDIYLTFNEKGEVSFDKSRCDKNGCIGCQGDNEVVVLGLTFPSTINGVKTQNFNRRIEFKECKPFGECAKFYEDFVGNVYTIKSTMTAFSQVMIQFVLEYGGMKWHTIPFALKFNESISAKGAPTIYVVRANTIRCTASPSVVSVESGGTCSLRFTADTGWLLPTTITLIGIAYDWVCTDDRKQAVLTLKGIQHNVSVDIACNAVDISDDDEDTTPLQINSFYCAPSSGVIGKTERVNVAWRLNKEPTSLFINNERILASKEGMVTYYDVAETTEYVLTASDGRTTETAQAQITFSEDESDATEYTVTINGINCYIPTASGTVKKGGLFVASYISTIGDKLSTPVTVHGDCFIEVTQPDYLGCGLINLTNICSDVTVEITFIPNESGGEQQTVYSYFGASTKSTVSDSLFESLDKKAVASLSGEKPSIKIKGGEYCWFISPTAINSIMLDNFPVAYIEVNSAYSYNGKTYHCYRIEESFIGEDTYDFIIS